MEQALPFKWDERISWKLTLFLVLTYAETGYVLLKQNKYALRGFTGGKQWWNISCHEISLEQKCVSV